MAETLALVTMRQIARGTTHFHRRGNEKAASGGKFYCCLALLEVKTDYLKVNPGNGVRVQAENYLHWKSQVAELQGIGMGVKPVDNNRQGLYTRIKGVALQVVSLQEANDLSLIHI